MFPNSISPELLNVGLLATVSSLKSPPTGAKHFMFKGISGVAASERVAKLHAQFIRQNGLKQSFEMLGAIYQIAPALLAGMASRESDMRATLQPDKSIYWGWGDKSIRGGEKTETFHGFGILQLDRLTCPFPEVRRELNDSLGKIKLNPYEFRWLQWGVLTFTTKLRQAGDAYPKLNSAERFATALSKYNGGRPKYYYPENDKYTTHGDYANDTLARAIWYAKNWGQV